MAPASSAPVTTAPAMTEPAAPEAKPADQVAAAPADQPAAPPVELGADINVAVEAVEIEGRKVFIAGAAPAGRTVRIYANDLLLGDAKASPENRFLLEAERDLKVGDYIIRADVLSPDGSKVIARAAVPFEREPGEAVAAVAPLEPAAPPAGQPVPAAPGAVAGTEPAAPGAPAVTPPADQPVSPGSTSPNPDVAAADGAHPGNPTPSAPQDQAAASPADAAPAPGAPPAKPADQAGVAPAPQPDQAAAAPAAPGQDQAAAAPASPNTVDGMPAEAAAPGDVATAPGTNAPADASTPPVAAAAPDASAPAPVDAAAPPVAGATAPKLQAVGSGVIIRRGDSLWRISKRVYGRGTRYSTIYVANRQQIRNPDLIWPGQIFRVPEKSDRGEDADMKAIGDQATTVQ